MHAWEQIQLTIEWIEIHLDQNIEIEELAKIAGLSPFYYQRLFGRLVKKPVSEYIRLRRMAKATERLLAPESRILDVALELGFSSHEHFSRIFKQTFGITPDEYRKRPRTFNTMTKPELSLHYVVVDEGVPLITEGIVLEINRRQLREPVCFAGMKADAPIAFIDGLGTESGADPLDDLWRAFHERKEKDLGLAGDSEEIGVTLPCAKEGHFTYFAGGRTDAASVSTTENYESWELPAGEYIVCSFEAESFIALVMDVLYKAEQYLFGTWMPGHKLQSEPFCAERYQSHSPQMTSMEVWLKLSLSDSAPTV